MAKVRRHYDLRAQLGNFVGTWNGSQWDSASGERLLWISVLYRAFSDLIKVGGVYDKQGEITYRETAKAFFLNSEYFVGSFDWICDEVGISQSSRKEIVKYVKREKLL